MPSKSYSVPSEQPAERSKLSQDEMNDILNRLVERLHSESPERSTATAPAQRQNGGLSLEDFIETATQSVLRAVDAHEQRLSDERNVALSPAFLRIPPIWFGLVIGQALEQLGTQTQPKKE